LKVEKVSPVKVAERRKQGLCYYYDEKYSPGHKCREQKFSHVDASTSSSYEYIPSDEAPNPEEAQPSDYAKSPVVTPLEPKQPFILLHALSGILAP
jgi:hypothetical protein